VVCSLSVGRSAALSPTKTAEQVEVLFGLWTCVGLRRHVLDGGPDPHANGKFRGENVVCTANGWLKERDKQSSTTESNVCRNNGPSAFQL